MSDCKKGFCGRCGEPCVAQCHCGGQPKAAAGHQVLYSRSRTPETDRWSLRYISKSPGTTPKTASRTLPSQDDLKSSKSTDAWQAKRAKHLSLPANTFSNYRHQDASSHQSRDAADVEDWHLTKEVQEVEETITRAFGSVLDPVHQRTKWSCQDCGVTFLRDQKVFPHPKAKSDPTVEHALYCPPCFAKSFNLGSCVTCGHAVLPDAATPFIQRKDKIWHAHCYACLYCAADLSKKPQVDLYGNPCCATCFDNAAFLMNPTVDRVPALLSADKSSPSQGTGTEDSSKWKQQQKLILMPMSAKMGPAVSELRSKWSAAGTSASSSPQMALSPSPSPMLQPKTPFSPLQNVTVRTTAASPRIAASKAFFDNAGSSASAQAKQPFSYGLGLGIGNRPAASNTTQIPPWQRHKSSQSVPVLPKSDSYFPPVTGSTRADKTNTRVAAPSNPPSMSTTQRPSGASKPSSSKVPVTPNASISSHDATLEQVSGRSSEVPKSPSKVSAGILSRSKSFIRQETDSQSNSEFHPTARRVEAKRPLPKPPIDDSVKTPRGLVQRKADAGGQEVRPSTALVTRPSAATRTQSSSQKVAQSSEHQDSGIAIQRRLTSQKEDSKPVQVLSGGIPQDAKCSSCKLRLSSLHANKDQPTMRIVTVPNTDLVYHSRCFNCSHCNLPFEDGKYVMLENDERVHEKCAPPKPVLHTTAHLPKGHANMPEPSRPADLLSDSKVLKPSRSAARLQQQYSSAAQVSPMSPSKTQVKSRQSLTGPAKLSKASEIFASRDKALSSPVFGGMYLCAGCNTEGTLAETTIGPVGTRFHHRCLRCFCGKQLDSGAKSYDEVGPNGQSERKFACRTCIDTKSLAQRGQSSVPALRC